MKSTRGGTRLERRIKKDESFLIPNVTRQKVFILLPAKAKSFGSKSDAFYLNSKPNALHFCSTQNLTLCICFISKTDMLKKNCNQNLIFPKITRNAKKCPFHRMK